MTQVLRKPEPTPTRARPHSAKLGYSVALATALTTWLACLSWSGFTVDPVRFLLPTFVIGAATVAAGVLARSWRTSRPLTVLAQTTVCFLGIFIAVSGSLVPTQESTGVLIDAFAHAIETARLYTSPIPRSAPSVHPLLIASGAFCLLIVDVLANTLRRASWAGLPLLLIYLLPSAMNGTPVAWWVFPVAASGYLVVLYLCEHHDISRWGRNIESLSLSSRSRAQATTSASSGPFDSAATAHHRRHAISIGLPAVVLASVIAVITPSWDLSGWGPGSGSGAGSDEITIQSPMTDLRRDLVRGRDVPWVVVQTQDPDPDYLRIAVLNRFSQNAWTSGDRNFPNDQTARGQELSLVGTNPQVKRQTYDYQISATSAFDSTWLPTPYPASNVSAIGVWKYDRDTMDFLAAEDGLSTTDLVYSATSVDLEFDAENLATAAPGAGAVPAIFTRLPDDLPELVQTLSDEVTESAPSQFEKAVALQSWFRDTGGFEYSLNTAPGSGTDELVAFLTPGDGGRVGYCEQFASAMAVLARAQGIPARVAVGFLTPERLGPNTWEYSSWDLHAWPELYFPGAGWVKFEPTPGARAEGVPAYTTQDLSRPEPEPSASASASSSAASSTAPQTRDQDRSEDPALQTSSDSSLWLRLVGVALAVLVVGGVLAIPKTIRARRRKRRWAAVDRPQSGANVPEIAWSELHDTVIDLGRRWPSGLSPRETHGRLASWLGPPMRDRGRARENDWSQRTIGVNPEAKAALDRIVLALEESRYSAQPMSPDPTAFRADVERCLVALGTGVSVSAQRQATWWPRSALSRESTWASSRPARQNEEVLDGG